MGVATWDTERPVSSKVTGNLVALLAAGCCELEEAEEVEAGGWDGGGAEATGAAYFILTTLSSDLSFLSKVGEGV